MLYCCLDVDEAASLLTDKLVDVLNVHAPCIVYQQRKHYAAWVYPDTVKLMKDRNQRKEKAKAMANLEGRDTSPEQALLWEKYKQLRNQVSNRTGRRKSDTRREKLMNVRIILVSSGVLQRGTLDWSSPGPPTQLEVEKEKKITLVTKAKDIASVLNEFFITKLRQL